MTANIRNLSFVYHVESAQEGESWTNHWHVHPTGNFEQDKATTKTYARELASHLAENTEDCLHLWTIIENVLSAEDSDIRQGFIKAIRDFFLASAVSLSLLQRGEEGLRLAATIS